MDFTQRKLTKQEWEYIEIPISAKEKDILSMIKSGFNNPNIKFNRNNSFLTFAKLENSDAMEKYIFVTYFQKRLEKIYAKNSLTLQKIKTNAKLMPKKRDLIRLENVNERIKTNSDSLYEYAILDLIEKMLSNHAKGKDKWLYYYYTLTHLKEITLRMNAHLLKEVECLLSNYSEYVNYNTYLENAEYVIEKNEILLKYTDIELYEHQKQIFQVFKSSTTPRLILYVAPTGTGKTLTPIGLSEKYRIIFVCAARHVGLEMAKSAISANRKIALAFNCGDADDIRLHFAAAKEYTKNYKTGGIYRVDNSVGDNVEIMISDVESYIIAMRYMTAFNNKNNIITYWDEPTITMDRDEHPFHESIHRNWRDNVIPNIVFSSATLPHADEITDVIADYIARFQGEPLTIQSADCNNSIPLISKSGNVTLPHHLEENSDYENMISCIKYCSKHTSLIRYMDLPEICNFILFLNDEKYINDERYTITSYFEATHDVTIKNIKMYYLKLFNSIDKEKWQDIFDHFQKNRIKQYNSNILITTKDAHTLTHGPSIYLANDIEKVARFYLQQSKIPTTVITHIQETIKKNNKITSEIEKCEMIFENTMSKENEKNNKMGNEDRLPPNMKILREKIETLRQSVRSVTMPELYIPNSPEHIHKWAKDTASNYVFTPHISDDYVIKLMQLNDVEPMWKLLLLMGIGVFMNHKSIGYVDIMKALAHEQKLLLVLATDDYIYGTNYQFCHGYLGKDLTYLTQEKLIQAIGRIGRNKQNKDYSVRMRDDSFISKLFIPLDVKKEADTMNRLFTSE